MPFILATRVLTAREFAGFSLAVVTHQITAAVVRAFAVEPEVAAGTVESRGVHIHGASVLLSVPVAAIAGAIGVVVGSDVGPALIVVAGLLPALVVHETHRLVGLATGSARIAAIGDALWLLVTTAILLAAITRGWDIGLAGVAFSWGFGGIVALAVLLRWAPLGWPRLSYGAWTRGRRVEGSGFVIEFAATTGASRALIYLLPLVSSLRELASFRGVQVAFGPVAMADQAVRTLGLTELGRTEVETAAAHPVRLVTAISTISMLIAGLWSMVLLTVNWVGPLLAGALWQDVRPIVGILGVSRVLAGLGLGPLLGLRAIGRIDRVLRIRMWSVPALLAAGIAGGSAQGAVGAVIGLATVQAIVAPVAWRAFRRAAVE